MGLEHLVELFAEIGTTIDNINNQIETTDQTLVEYKRLRGKLGRVGTPVYLKPIVMGESYFVMGESKPWGVLYIINDWRTHTFQARLNLGNMNYTTRKFTEYDSQELIPAIMRLFYDRCMVLKR